MPKSYAIIALPQTFIESDSRYLKAAPIEQVLEDTEQRLQRLEEVYLEDVPDNTEVTRFYSAMDDLRIILRRWEKISHNIPRGWPRVPPINQ